MTSKQHNSPDDLDSLHMILQLLQTVDVGIVTVNADFEVQMWNSFMENHSGIHTSDARGRDLFELFPELPAPWLRHKIESVFRLQIRAYSDWQQQPHLFRFKSSRPLTGKSELMYQNVTLIPLTLPDRTVSRVCLLIYDVTDIATSKLALQQANIALTAQSRTDALTRLHNRGYWEDCLSLEFQRCQRDHKASLILFDIDHFKPINDRYGHGAGDDVLRAVAVILHETQRQTDISGRYGGEEFGIILPDTGAQEAAVLAERLRKRMKKRAFDCGDSQVDITISLGICQFDTRFRTHQDWLQATDQALYCAKEEGRDRTRIFDPTEQQCLDSPDTQSA